MIFARKIFFRLFGGMGGANAPCGPPVSYAYKRHIGLLAVPVLRPELSRPCGPLLSRPLRASVRSFIGIRQVAPNDLDLA